MKTQEKDSGLSAAERGLGTGSPSQPHRSPALLTPDFRRLPSELRRQVSGV